jgi:hypothetical protein
VKNKLIEESMAAEDEQENEQAAHPPITGKFKKALRITGRDVDILMNGLHLSIV